MQVVETSSIMGWFFRNTLRVETRETYHYENGNDVTVTRYHDITVSLYDRTGAVVDEVLKGRTVDNRA